MKIGILTLPFNVNYGGILQAYALQTYLQSHGNEVVFINRVYGKPSFLIVFKRILSLLKCIFRKYILGQRSIIISNPFGVGYITRKGEDLNWSKVQSFVTSNLNVSKPLNSTKMVSRFVAENKIECVIVGSDQVWRDCYNPNIYDYFLGFLSKKTPVLKATYAASFGVYTAPIPWYKLHQCKSLCKRFQFLSVREHAAVLYMEQHFGVSPVLSLDPTLLLKASDYDRFTHAVNYQNRYIAAYFLNATKDKQLILEQLQVNLGYDVKVLSTEVQYNKSEYAPSVEEWLTTLKNASFVITDSFHGSVFSLLFAKNFIAISNCQRGDDRLVSLFEDLSLEDRLVFSYNHYISIGNIEFQNIDYEQVWASLSKKKRESMNYLENIMNYKFSNVEKK